MSWKMIVASHWKVALLLLQLGLFILMTTVNSLGDIVDNPGGP